MELIQREFKSDLVLSQDDFFCSHRQPKKAIKFRICGKNRMRQNELDYALGLGEHQVSGEEGRIEHAVGIAVLAYLLRIRACHQDISPGKWWSVSQLQYALRLRMIMNQAEHKVKVNQKRRKAAS
jgi:hypothetical protein